MKYLFASLSVACLMLGVLLAMTPRCPGQVVNPTEVQGIKGTCWFWLTNDGTMCYMDNCSNGGCGCKYHITQYQWSIASGNPPQITADCADNSACKYPVSVDGSTDCTGE
jgi:hypothetical protein